MLPVIVYDDDERELAGIGDIVEGFRSALRVSVLTTHPEEAAQFIRAEKGMIMLISALGSSPDAEGAMLARLAQEGGRGGYVVLLLESLDALDRVLDGSFQISGLLVRPFSRNRAARLIRSVALAFGALGALEEEYLTFGSGGACVRVPVRSVLYLEAQGKKLEIWTRRQSVSVYGTFLEVEKALPDTFLRVHRSYIVRLAAIRTVSFPDMEIMLQGGARIPLSRSRKAALSAWLKENGGGILNG